MRPLKKIYPSLGWAHFPLVKRAGWLVTKFYQHFTFSQSKYKKDFAIMNQNSSIDTSVFIPFCVAFSTYLNEIRSESVGQTDSRSKFLHLEIHEIF